MILLRLFAGQNHGYYVDVGAHHPFRFSNTCALYQRGWSGINIDADPQLLDAFKRHRPGDISLATGVSDLPGTMMLHVFDEPALNTFDAEVAREKAQDGTYKIVTRISVPVQRLDAILAAHLPAAQTIDLLTIDAEGFDYKVLQSIDWQQYRPRCVVVEILSRSLPNAMVSPAHTLLDHHGYGLYAKTGNSMIYIDMRKPAL